METISNPQVKCARKEHVCNFCTHIITLGENYNASVHKDGSNIYQWKTHLHCEKLAVKLSMYQDCEEGVSTDDFLTYIDSEYFNIKGGKYGDYKNTTISERLETVLTFHNILKEAK